MRSKRILVALVALLVGVTSLTVYAQVQRPYRQGSVWNLAFIRMKPGWTRPT